jgi:hypothetical protein
MESDDTAEWGATRVTEVPKQGTSHPGVEQELVAESDSAEDEYMEPNGTAGQTDEGLARAFDDNVVKCNRLEDMLRQRAEMDAEIEEALNQQSDAKDQPGPSAWTRPESRGTGVGPVRVGRKGGGRGRGAPVVLMGVPTPTSSRGSSTASRRRDSAQQPAQLQYPPSTLSVAKGVGAAHRV